jgi:2',3'-cyclic-nucleotide 2'-phosphodiesterase/3'-nucleotidase
VIIISTNDVHGKYFDSLYVGGEANPSSYANVSTFINNIRSIGVSPVLVDVGDNLQGDVAAYYFDYIDTADVHVLPRIMNYIGYDAVVVGNHDIETGHNVYDKVRSELGMPYLAANAIRTDGSGNPYFDDYTIVRRNGIKIAIIGFTNPRIPDWISPVLYSGMEFDSIPPLAQHLVDSVINKEHPQIVVVAVHSGTGDGSPDDFENVGLRCAKMLHGVDVVLCSHDHIAYSTIVAGIDSNKVLLLNAGKHARFVGLGNIELVVKKGKVVSKRISGHTVPMDTVAVDTSYVRTFRSDYEKVKQFTDKDIGMLDNGIDCSDALYGPSSYVHLLQSVVMEQTEAQISICAPLTLTATFEKGPITVQDLFTLYPYENQLYVLKMKGSQVKGMLEMSYDLWARGEGFKFNYDSAEGIVYEVSKSAPDGKKVRIKSMEDGVSFSEDSTYLVALTSYRASGGDFIRKGAGIGQSELNSLIVSRYPEIRDMLYEYIIRHHEIDPKPGNNWKFVK